MSTKWSPESSAWTFFSTLEAFDPAYVGDHVEYEIVRVLTRLTGHRDSDGLEIDWVQDSE